MSLEFLLAHLAHVGYCTNSSFFTKKQEKYPTLKSRVTKGEVLPYKKPSKKVYQEMKKRMEEQK
jgi:hypothetical protein